MVTATWVLVGATSIGAVLTRRGCCLAAQEQQWTRADDQRERNPDAVRKEIAAKDDVGGLKSDPHRRPSDRGRNRGAGDLREDEDSKDGA